MKKPILVIVFLNITLIAFAWSPYDTYETGEQVAAMASNTKEEMFENNQQMIQNASGGLSWSLRFTGGRTVNSFLFYDNAGKFIRYEIHLPYDGDSFDFLVASSGNYYNRRGKAWSSRESIPLGVVYSDRRVQVRCTIELELLSMLMRPVYSVTYLQ